MRKMTFHSLWLALVCLSCVGGEGTTCFQDDECDSPLICCHVGSPFTQGSCQAQDVCDELQGGTGGTPGTGGVSGGAGTGGAGAGGIGGFGGMGGAAGAGGGGGGG